MREVALRVRPPRLALPPPSPSPAGARGRGATLRPSGAEAEVSLVRLHHVPGDELAELHASRLRRQCQCRGCIGEDCFAAFNRGGWTPGLGRELSASSLSSLSGSARVVYLHRASVAPRRLHGRQLLRHQPRAAAAWASGPWLTLNAFDTDIAIGARRALEPQATAQRATAARSRSTNTRRSNLPAGVLGISATISSRSSFLYAATRSATQAINSSGVACPFSTTKAFGTSPCSSSGLWAERRHDCCRRRLLARQPRGDAG